MPKNLCCYLDISIGKRLGGRISFELFYDTTPKTAENFKCLCTGERGISNKSRKALHYVGCRFFRVLKNFIIQSGDIINNNGSGGESIYPQNEFNDENFNRRHAQAGVLSMANVGKNTNTSQFFITLKRLPQLDNKHVVFGQVVEGMDIVRAIEKLPVDDSFSPRVYVVIVGSGVVGAYKIDRLMGENAPKNEVEKLMKEYEENNKALCIDENEEEIDDIFNNKEKKKITKKTAVSDAIEKLNKAYMFDDSQNKKENKEVYKEDNNEKNNENKEKNNEEKDEKIIFPSKKFDDARKQKLFELQLRRNQSRKLNNKEVLEEKKRLAGYSSEKKEEKHAEKEEKLEEENTGRNYLNITAELAEKQKAKNQKKKESFGWQIFTNDAVYNRHKKRVYELPHDAVEYEKQKKQMGDKIFDLLEPLNDQPFEPSEEAKDRLAEHVDKVIKKRGNFSRRRADYEECYDVSYINERNKNFNKKLDRAFGSYTLHIKQNLERGTAL